LSLLPKGQMVANHGDVDGEERGAGGKAGSSLVELGSCVADAAGVAGDGIAGDAGAARAAGTVGTAGVAGIAGVPRIVGIADAAGAARVSATSWADGAGCDWPVRSFCVTKVA